MFTSFPSTENKRSSFLTRAGAAEIGRRYSDFSVEEDEMIAAKYGDFKQWKKYQREDNSV